MDPRLRAVARRVASERDRECPHPDGRCDLVVLQNFFGRDACAVHVAHVILVRLDHDALELESGKQTFAAGVGEDLSIELQVGCCSGLPTTGPAATDASPPSVNSFESKLFRPSLFMKSITKSVDSAPICNPKLPPPRVK